MNPAGVVQVADSVERLIALARSIDLDLLQGHGEPLERLVGESQRLAQMTAESDPFELSQLLTAELRRRRNLR